MIFMVRSSHLGQVLLRNQMLPLALSLNLDAAHASAEDIPEKDLTQIAYDNKVQVKVSSKQMFGRLFLAIFQKVWEYASLVLLLYIR